MFKQLTLSFAARTQAIELSIYSGNCNRDAILWLNKWPYWGSNGLVICGASGLGKSYLANFWGNKAAAAILNQINIRFITDLIYNPNCSLVLDDLDKIIANNLCDESDILHLINIYSEHGYYLLITCQNLGFINRLALKDLSSRLLFLPVVHIQIPDVTDLYKILEKQFCVKQVIVCEQIIKYLSNNIPRSFAAVKVIIEWLDNITLTRKSKINIELVKEGVNILFS